VILQTWKTYTNHVQETLPVHMPRRLQGTQETTAALLHSADLRPLRKAIEQRLDDQVW